MNAFDYFARELAFIEEQHDKVAALAWREYLRHGRGALAFLFNEAGMGKVAYISKSRLKKEGTPEEVALAKRYDPQREVFLILVRGERMAHLRFVPNLPPPAAYEALGEDEGLVLALTTPPGRGT